MKPEEPDYLNCPEFTRDPAQVEAGSFKWAWGRGLRGCVRRRLSVELNYAGNRRGNPRVRVQVSGGDYPPLTPVDTHTHTHTQAHCSCTLTRTDTHRHGHRDTHTRTHRDTRTPTVPKGMAL
jgi:hypothetical protein